VARTELGARFDKHIALDNGAILTLRGRAAWAYDTWSNYSMTAAFERLPGSTFTVFGATPARDSLSPRPARRSVTRMGSRSPACSTPN